MSLVTLVEAQPWAPDGGAVAVRLAGGGSRGYVHRGYVDWLAGVAGVPRFTSMIGFDIDARRQATEGQAGGFTGGSIPTTGALAFLPSDPSVGAALAQLNWPGAPITIWQGDDAFDPPAWTPVLVGTVAGLQIRRGAISITISDLSGDLAKPLLTDRFAGTGGLEGIAEAKERIKRRSWGRVWNVEARILDKANNVYELGDPARPMLAIDAVKDRGRAGPLNVIPWAGSAAATLAALQAATAPAGGAAVAPSIACVKWWTQPAGPLTADLRGELGAGYVETAPAIASRVIAARSTLAVTGLDAAIAARPGACGLHIDSEQETAAQALDRLLLGVSTLWVVEPAGAVRLSPIALDVPVEDLIATEFEREAAYKPVTERLLGYQRNQRRHTDAELSAVFQAADGTYADGTPIEDLRPAERGANVTETRTAAAIVGQGALATRSFADWATQVLGTGKPEDYATVGARTGTNLVSGAGRGVLSDAAIVTVIGTAAAITGQGVLATRDVVVDGLLGGTLATRVAPHPINGNYLGTDTIAYPGGATVSSLEPQEASANRTESRTAAAIAGQGALATLNAANWGSQVTGRPANLAALTGGEGINNSAITITVDGRLLGAGGGGVTFGGLGGGAVGQQAFLSFGSVLLRRADGSTTATDADYRTALGTASAITGQGVLATRDLVVDGLLGGTLATRVAPHPINGNYLGTDTIAYPGGATVSSLQPQEASANRTEARTAAAIMGQGALATQSTANWGSQVAGRPANLAALTGAEGIQNNAITITVDGRLLGAGGGGVTYGGLGGGAVGQQAFLSFGSALLRRGDGTTTATDADYRTALGTASAITGQGALATLNSVPGSRIDLSPGNLIVDSLLLDPASWTIVSNATLDSSSTADLALLGAVRAYRHAAGSGNCQYIARPVQAIGGASYIASAKALAKAGCTATITVAVQFLDRAGGWLGQQFRNISLASTADTVVDLTVRVTAPAGTATMQMVFFAGAWTGGDFYTGLHAIRAITTPGIAGLGDTSNMVPDPDFADAALTWPSARMTTTPNTTAGRGAGANRLVISSLAGADGARTSAIPLAPGESIYLSIYIQTISGTTGNLLIAPQWFDAAGTFLGYGSYVLYASGETGRYATIAKAPANTASVRYFVYSYGGGDRVWHLSEPQMFRTATLGRAVVREDGTTLITDAAAITALGTAAAITGQGALATQSTANWGSQVTGRPANLAALTGVEGINNSAITITVDGRLLGAGGGGVTFGGLGGGAVGQQAFLSFGSALLRRADASTTATDADYRTALGTASAIVGQGRGATANSLADLDPAAATQLTGGGVEVAAPYDSIKKLLSPGASLALSARVSADLGGGSGTIYCVIQSSLAGSGSWTDVAGGAGGSIGPTEPGADAATATFTAGGSTAQLYEFRVIDRRTPTGAGGPLITARSYLRA